MTVLAASGDSGATDYEYNETTYYDFPVTSWPDSDPLVTGVGGTELHLDGVGNRTAPDSVWNDTYDTAADGFGVRVRAEARSPVAAASRSSSSGPAYQNGVAKIVGRTGGCRTSP